MALGMAQGSTNQLDLKLIWICIQDHFSLFQCGV